MRYQRQGRMAKRVMMGIIIILTLFYGISSGNQDLKTAPPIRSTSIASASGTIRKVIRVIDGDTIELDTKEKVRYIGVDTPELHDPRKKVECFAKEAYLENQKLVEGKSVRLDKDISDKDKYGRLLRYVYLDVKAVTQSFFVNEYLVKEGYANVSTFPPDVKFSDLFLKAEKVARENKKGLWFSCK